MVKTKEGNNFLNAYQIAFDICDKENQTYQKEVLDILTKALDKYDHPDDESTRARIVQMCTILKGEIRDRLYLQFLRKNNHTDV